MKHTLGILIAILFVNTQLLSAQGESCENPITAVQGKNLTEVGEQWFKYTATQDGMIILTLSGKITGYSNVSIYTDCDTKIDFAVSDCYARIYYSVESNLGDEFYINWKCSYSEGTYEWELEEKDVEKGNFCSDPVFAYEGENTFNSNRNQYQWFTFEATKTGKITISSCGKTDDDTDVVIYDGCDANVIDYRTDCCEYQSKSGFEGVEGSVYYIRWKNRSSSDSFNWTITQSDWEQGETCENPLTAVVGSDNLANHSNGTDQWFSYTATMDGLITVSACDLSTVYATEVEVYNSCTRQIYDSPYLDEVYCDKQGSYKFESTAGQTYLFKWDKYLTEGGSYNWSLIEEELLVGDACSNPIIVTDGIIVSSNNQWHMYESHADGELIISSCDKTDDDTSVEVFEGGMGDCDYLYQLDYNDDYCDNQSYVKVYVYEGWEYLIKWENHSSDDDISWTLSGPGALCDIPITAEEGYNQINSPDATELWYTYSATEYGTATVSACGSDVIEVYNSCNDKIGSTCVDCGSENEFSFSCEYDNEYLIKWIYGDDTNGYCWYVGSSSDVTTNVKESLLDDNILYPNPTNDFFTINSDKELLQLIIYDSLGKEMDNIRGNVKTHHINYPEGIYVLKLVYVNGLVHTYKLIVK